MYEDSKIGASYGFRHQTGGIKIYDYATWYWGVPLFLASDIEWRLPRHGNGYFSAELTRHDIGNRSWPDITFSIGCKRIVSRASGLTRQFYSGPGFYAWHYGLVVGHAWQDRSKDDTRRRTHNGVLIQLYKELFVQLDIKVTAIYWFNEFQYSVNVREDIFRSGWFVGVGWEKVNDWKEFNISMMHILHY